MDLSNIAKNIRRLMKVRGMSSKQLAQKADLGSSALSNLLNGKTLPQSMTLIKLAGALNVSVDQLLVSVPELHAIRFRTCAVLSAREKAAKEQLKVDVASWLKNFNELQNVLNIPNVWDLTGTAFPDCTSAAQIIRRDYFHLDECEPVCDFVSQIEALGIKLWIRKFGFKRTFGLSVGESDGGPAIIVNNDPGISIERQIFTIAHELGHLLLHLDSYTSPEDFKYDDEEEENEADRFAGELLLPLKGLSYQWTLKKGLSFVDRVLYIKHLYKVSYRTVLVRLQQMIGTGGVNLFIRFAVEYKEQYGHDLKDHYEPPVCGKDEFVASADPEALQRWDLQESHYRSLVRDAYERELISISKAGELLGKTISEMRKITSVWKADIA